MAKKIPAKKIIGAKAQGKLLKDSMAKKKAAPRKPEKPDTKFLNFSGLPALDAFIAQLYEGAEKPNGLTLADVKEEFEGAAAEALENLIAEHGDDAKLSQFK